MSKRRRQASVFLTEPGRIELAVLLTPWLRVGAAFGPYVECRKVDLDGEYVELVMSFEPADDESMDVRLSIPHHYVAAVLEVADHEAFGALYSG